MYLSYMFRLPQSSHLPVAQNHKKETMLRWTRYVKIYFEYLTVCIHFHKFSYSCDVTPCSTYVVTSR